MPRTLRVPVDDTELFVLDGGGAGAPVVFLNGAFSSTGAWRPVVKRLGPQYRPILFDARGRGRSGRSGDYALDSARRDLRAVLAATGADRPILVGWSLGAFTAVEEAACARGLVLVDGALPYAWIDDAARAQMRRHFESQRFVLPLAARLGLAGRMSAVEHAGIVIELNERLPELTPQLAKMDIPVDYILASGASLGGQAEEFERMRATLGPVLEANPRVQLFHTSPANHLQILRQAADAIVAAIARVSEAPAHAAGRDG